MDGFIAGAVVRDMVFGRTLGQSQSRSGRNPVLVVVAAGVRASEIPELASVGKELRRER